jgi:hypothetical protein
MNIFYFSIKALIHLYMEIIVLQDEVTTDPFELQIIHHRMDVVSDDYMCI